MGKENDEKNEPKSKTPNPVGLTEETDAQGVVWVTLTHDIDGNAFLPEAQPKAVKKIWEKGVKYETIKTARMDLTKKESDAKADTHALYKEFPQFFKPSETDPNVLIYSVGGLVVEVLRKETFEVKTHKDAPPPISAAAQENEAAKTGSKGKGKKGGKTPADVF